MRNQPASAPTDSPPSDFDEDTLLPPPAPGMEVPSHEMPPSVAVEHSAIPEHIVDAPTMQGLRAARPTPDSDPLLAISGDTVARVLAELPIDRTQRLPLFVPSRLREDDTPIESHRADLNQAFSPLAVSDSHDSMTPIDPGATVELPQPPRSLTVRFPTVLPNATAPLPMVSNTETQRMETVSPKRTMRFPSLPPSGPPAALLADEASAHGESTAEIARAALHAASTIEMPAVPPQLADGLSRSEVSLSQSTRSMPKISVPPPSEDTLPPLPLLSSSDTVSGRLLYAVSGLRSLLRRRRLMSRLRGELGERLVAYDRALVQLGELAYAEHVELMRHVPGSDATLSDEIPTGKDETQQRVQRAAERCWAKLQKEQRALTRKEAMLASELRVLRHRRDELYQRLLILAGDLRSGEASSDERYAVGMELAGIDGDSHKVAARLGEVRSELRLLRRQNHHLRTRREQLLYALSLDYADLARRSPHLLVLGALMASFRPQPAPDKDKRARFDSLYALLDGLRGGIAKVETRLALLTGSRRTADKKALRTSLLWLVSLSLVVGGGLLLMAFYLLSS